MTYSRSLSIPAVLLGVLLLGSLGAANAHAVLLRVDWSASVLDVTNAATGTLSGSLGEFEVTSVGQEFALPADGSLGVTSSGFISGFPNGTFPFNEYDSIIIGAGSGLKLRFDALGPTPAVSLIPIGGNLAYLSTFSVTTPCLIAGEVGGCAIILGRNLDQVLIEGDIAGIYAINSALGNPARAAEVQYTFTVLSGAPIPAAHGSARWLLACFLLFAFSARPMREAGC